MRNLWIVVVVSAIGLTAVLVGTAVSQEEPEGTKPTMPEPAAPPAELKALDAFVGDWQGSYEFMPAMFGEPGKGSGTWHCEWVLDNWFVMGKGTSESTFGPHKSIWLATYDPKTASYRSYSFDNHGTSDVATMTYDPGNRTWTTVSQGYCMKTGKPAENKSTMQFVDNNTLKWEWSQKVEGQTDFQLMMKGSETRQAK